MFWLSALVLVSEAEEQSTQEIVDSWMMKTQDDHFQQIPCADSCKRWDLSNPDTFNYFWLRDTEWLSTANRYGVGNHLLPEETSTMT